MNIFEIKYYNELNAPIGEKTWMWQQYLKFNSQKKSFFEQKIADYFDASNDEYLFKWPVWEPKEKRSFFVDFYLPEYRLMIDIETYKKSQYYDEEYDEIRKQLLYSIKGMRYFIVKRRDLWSDDFKDKICEAMSSRSNYRMGNDRKRIKSPGGKKSSRSQKKTRYREGL